VAAAGAAPKSAKQLRRERQDALLQQAARSRLDPVSGKVRCQACGKTLPSHALLAQHLKDKHGGVNSEDVKYAALAAAQAPAAAAGSSGDFRPTSGASGGAAAATAASQGKPRVKGRALLLSDLLFAPSRRLGARLQPSKRLVPAARPGGWLGAQASCLVTWHARPGPCSGTGMCGPRCLTRPGRAGMPPALQGRASLGPSRCCERGPFWDGLAGC
jgi:hypothetical protein